MTVWQYVKIRMEKYSDKPVLEDGTTYGELIAFIQERAKRYDSVGRLVCASGRSRIAHALEILCALASGNAVVPVDDCYGNERRREIERTVGQDTQEYPEIAFVMFTSGTGGKQKGVMLSHENVISNLIAIETYFDVSPEDRILIARPLVHIAVIVGELLYGLCRGATIQFYEQPFLPSQLKRAVFQKHSTVMGGTPTLFRNLLRISPTGLPLRACVISGERLSAESAAALAASWQGTEFYNVYGLTEHSPRVSALLPQDFSQRPGSVGKPLCGVQAEIRNGELLVKSNSVMQGYYGDEQRTNAVIKDGWLHTGDMAHWDNDGYLYIDGRKDNMIIRSGLNVYPEEIESAANACLGVENCVAYGQEDEFEGQRIILEYCGEANEQFVRKFLSTRLAPHMLPRVIKKVNLLASTPSGKTARKC